MNDTTQHNTTQHNTTQHNTTQHNTTQHNTEIEIYIATHKNYTFFDVDGFIPIQVGKAISLVDLGFVSDDTGDNISAKNKNYCELTALYWMWKNAKADILGLYHYRRYLGVKEDNELKILDTTGLKELIKDENTIVTNGRSRVGIDGKILTVREIYEKYHHIKDWLLLKEIFYQYYPDYIEAFETVENSQVFRHCNLLVAHRNLVHKYCEWLFGILFKLEERVDISEYDDYQKRIFGFLSERLFNVYLEKHKDTIKLTSLAMIDIPAPIKITSKIP